MTKPTWRAALAPAILILALVATTATGCSDGSPPASLDGMELPISQETVARMVARTQNGTKQYIVFEEHNREQLEAKINVLGKQGYEVVEMTIKPAERYGYVVIMGRRQANE